MKPEEAIAKKYLESEGYEDPEFEPDGNVSPDFALDRRIAVEVRGLNHTRLVSGQTRSLEEDAIPLERAFEQILRSYGPPTEGRSWFVSYECIGHFPPVLTSENNAWKRLHSELRSALDEFLLRSWDGSHRELDCGLRLFVNESQEPRVDKFRTGMTASSDTGTLVASELKRNIAICMQDKTRRYDNHLRQGTIRVDKYDEWWLLLVDKTGSLFLADSEKQEIMDAIVPIRPWSKIVVIDQHTCRHLITLDA